MSQKPPIDTAQEVQTCREDIIRTLSAAEELLGISITIHDRSGIFRDPDGNYLLDHSRGTHQHPCCGIMHDQRCLMDCRDRVDTRAEHIDRYWVHRCWKGMEEVVVPVVRNRSLLFVLFAGGFRNKRYKKIPPDKRLPKLWVKTYRSLPVMGKATAERIGLAMTALSHGLLHYTEKANQLQREEEGRKGEIRRFLYYHAHEQITLDDLARILHLSRFRTSHLVTALFGRPFQALLVQERISRARSLLVSTTDRTAGEIGRMVGMPDEYHFNRAFKKVVGLPPGRFRKQHRTGT